MGVSASGPLPTAGGSQPQQGAVGVRVAVKERYYAYLPRYINRKASLTEEKVRLVHRHWNFIADEVSLASDEIDRYIHPVPVYKYLHYSVSNCYLVDSATED